MRRLALCLILIVLVAAGCNAGGTSPTPEPTPSPADLLLQASSNTRAASTLRVSVDRAGAEYFFETDFGVVLFNSLKGQYVAPDVIQASARVLLGNLPLDVDIFARGADQWIRGVFTNMEWQNAILAEGFDPQTLIATEDSGLQAALKSLRNLSFVGETALEDGTAAYHLSSVANGEDVSALIVNIVQMTGEVTVDVFIDRERLLPLKFVIVQPPTGAQTATPGPTTWTIEFYDFDADPELNGPEGA
ncbi:MAG: LppX_LprAFG lipoprotein [Anaerolineae bacterium]|nr:LppX_LprAFG lipoprotein [Anaerolineae bacterium]